MRPSDWIALAGILGTVVMSVVSLVVSSRRERRQQERDDRLHQEQREREDRLRREQQERQSAEDLAIRKLSPHIEFEIACHFHGPEQGDMLVEVLLIARNRGNVLQQFRDIRLRLRGIPAGADLAYWPGNEPRLHFPMKLVEETSIKPERYHYFRGAGPGAVVRLRHQDPGLGEVRPRSCPLRI